ncbi:MAG TPA: TadE/TadG family type IV pilus assembly protein [Rhizomicrobium sp.]|jgi:Flp pilus assembly protein TadG|nr:TadE/TadG family type IV pilus assembly protein [Rhizomicrobium sp.]
MTQPRRDLRSFKRDQAGATAVEFALVSTALFAFIFGIAALGMMLFNDLSLQWAVTKASRIAEINNAATQSDVSTAVNAYLAQMSLPTATVSYSSSVGVNGVRTANISASYTQTYMVPMISTFTINFNSAVTVPQPS